jgi:serralysin
MLDGILWGGWRWVTPNSSFVNITYYLAGDNEFSIFDDAWTTVERAAIRTAFDAWSRVANVTFTQVFSAASATFIEHVVPGSFWNTPPGFIVLGEHDVPDNPAPAHGYYNWQAPGWDFADPNGGLQVGGIAFLTLLHEIGHGLGLAHPHDRGGGSGIWPGVTGPFNSYGANNLNQSIYTVMSYNRGWDAVLNPEGLGLTTYGYNGGPSAFDIAAVQFLYGANLTHRTGNDSYVLPDVNAAGTHWQCIWDAGGTDQIVYNGSRNTIIDLTAATLDISPTGGGALSYAAGIQGGFTIANGVVIENVLGGAGQDTIVGNRADNFIDGRGGVDTSVFSGSLSSYTVTSLGSTAAQVVGPDGRDVLVRVELLAFNDVTINANLPVVGDVLWQHTNGFLATTSGDLPSVSGGWQVSRIRDFDRDGDGDILWRHPDGRVVSWELEGGRFFTNHSIGVGSGGWDIVGCGDLDADGDSDILWRHTGGSVLAWELEDGNYRTTRHIAVASGGWAVEALGDFDADGDADILWRHTTAGTVVTWEMENGRLLSTHGIASASTSWQIQGTGDFDGDGDDDILWRHSNGAVVTWEMADGSLRTNHNIAVASTGWRIEGIGDFNADHTDDILWRNTNGTVVTWEMERGALDQVRNFGLVANGWQIRGTGELDLA